MAEGVAPAGWGFRPRVVEYCEDPEELDEPDDPDFDGVEELDHGDDPQAATTRLSAKANNNSR
jgi:hypothetical protein